MSNKIQPLQITRLDAWCQEQTTVTIYLANGVRITGVIESYDQFVIGIKNSTSQLVYKQAISTIMPSQAAGHEPVPDRRIPERTLSQAPRQGIAKSSPAVTVKRARKIIKDEASL